MGTPMTIVENKTVNNTTYPSNRTVEADVALRISKTLTRAKTATLTVRTNNTDGSLTLEASHGVVTGDRVDIYWEVAGVKGHRRGVTVGTVAGNVAPISGGAGDNLPALNTANIATMVAVAEEVTFTGNNLQFYVFKAPGNVRAIVVFANAGNAEVDFLVIEAGTTKSWDSGSGFTNPLAGDSPTKLFITHGDYVNTQTVVGDIGWN